MRQILRVPYLYTFLLCLLGALILVRPGHAAPSGIGSVAVPATMMTATPITVTTSNDSIANDTVCSLREAIIAANTDSAFSGCVTGVGADRIVFDRALPQPPVFVLTLGGADENNAFTGDLDISGTLTIDNGDNPIVLDGNNTDRVFEILPSATVSLSGVTIRHGNPAPVSRDGVVGAGGGNAEGGGVLINSLAHLTLTHSQVISNSAPSGGGIKVFGRLTLNDSTVAGNQGSGITNAGGLVTLTDAQLQNNGGYGIEQYAGALTFTRGRVEANQAGGVYNATAMATLTNLDIRHNRGSGVSNTGNTLTRLTITHSLILSNSATSGAGVFNEGIGASIDIYDTRLSGNQATSNGGAFFNSGLMAVRGSTVDHNQARAGAGLHHLGGNLSLINDTFSQNHASDNGGGLYNGGSAALNAVTFTQNRADGEGGNIFNDEAQLTIENSIVAHAQDGDNCVKSGGFLTSLGHNLESANRCHFTATGDLTNTDPLLGPLQDNGGPTPTHALLIGSPAIDQGASTCLATDQRGVPRPQGAACDSGAYEFAASADLALVTSIAPTTPAVGDRMTYTLLIENQGPLVADTLVLSDTLSNGATLLTATISSGLCGRGNPITCTVTTLGPGLTLTATIVATAPLSAGAITNTATISAATADLFPTNNRSVTLSTVSGPTLDLTPPSSVTMLTATLVTTNGATLTWTPASDNIGVAGYRIYAQKPNARQQPLLVGQVAGAATTYPVTTLAAHSAYQLWVGAYDQAGNQRAITDNASVQITTLALPIGMVQISLAPALPTDHDPISITVSGVYTSSCPPHYQSHQIIGALIEVQSAPSAEPFCLPAEFPWEYTIGIGTLTVGHYTVTHTLDSLVTRLVFTVTAAISPTLPVFHVDGSGALTAFVGTLFHYALQASGAPMLTYSLVQAPPGMTIDPATGQIAWTPTAAMVGTVIVTVRVSNALGSADHSFALTVQMSNNGGQRFFLPLVVRR